MGTTETIPPPTGLAGALFSPVQQRVLGILFGQPDRSFGSAELIRMAGAGTGAVHRFLIRLADSGLVTATRIGNQKLYRANRSSPIFDELHGLVVKTVGLVEPLRRALEPFGGKLRAAFVYGSVAKGTDTARSDVDLLVVTDEVDYFDLFEALQPVEVLLARKVSPHVLTVDEWKTRRAEEDSFVARIAAQPQIFVIGSPDDLA